jgi:O-antigen biosynthesis protein
MTWFWYLAYRVAYSALFLRLLTEIVYPVLYFLKLSKYVNLLHFNRWVGAKFNDSKSYGLVDLSLNELSANTVIFVDQYLPRPDRDAGSRTAADFVRTLISLGYRVIFVPFSGIAPQEDIAFLKDINCEVFCNKSALNTLRQALNRSSSFEGILFLNRPIPAFSLLRRIVARRKFQIIYYGHDIHYLRLENDLSNAKFARMKAKLSLVKSFETYVWNASDVVTYPTEQEVQVVKGAQESKPCFRVVPYVIESSLKLPKATQFKDAIIFVGSAMHLPNRVAITFLLNEVFPLVLLKRPACKLLIVGSQWQRWLLKGSQRQVETHFNVSADELTTLYGESSVAVAPLFSGAGLKLKVIEALAHGLPVVTSEIGNQGLVNTSSIKVAELVADSFAEAICTTLFEVQSGANLYDVPSEYIAEHFSQIAMTRSLLKVIASKKSA